MIPVFGQGRALYALVGDGIKHETIDRAATFLIGKCSCEVREQNPGFDLLLASEIRFAVPHATFALEEVALGLYPTGNATVLLPRQIPWVHAHELLLTARPISAERALAIGLVNEIVPSIEKALLHADAGQVAVALIFGGECREVPKHA